MRYSSPYPTLLPLIMAAIAMMLPLSVAADDPLVPGQVAYGYGTVNQAATHFSRSLPPTSIEGVWELTDNGAVIAVEKTQEPMKSGSDAYRMVYVAGPDTSLPHGSVIGYVVQGSTTKSYDVRIYTRIECDDNGDIFVSNPQSFALTITDDSRLELRHYMVGLKVNAWRLLPYMLGRVVSKRDDRPRNLDGMVRIFPDILQRPIVL